VAEWLRRAGVGRAPDGATVTWSVAAGRRGRRWREVIAVDGGIRSSLLLELDPEGRFSHLELSTASGLLTLHPEGDGTLHGNAITSAGIAHVRGLPWDRDRAIELEGSIVCAAAAFRPDGAQASSFLRIGLGLRMDTINGSPDRSLVTDEGLPRLAGGRTWPLEDEPER
jgi:hypothetical protein